jgi:1-acyl-sn-glycerol-3-phosphate acyltransferase
LLFRRASVTIGVQPAMREALVDDRTETHGPEDGSPRARTGPWIVVRALVRILRLAWLALCVIVRPARARRGDRAGLMRARAAVLGRASRKVMRIHGIELQVAGPIPQGPAIIASNHLSYLDPLVLAALVDAVPISKADLLGWPVFGRAARRLGVLFVARSEAHSRRAVMREAEQVLRDGGIVLNFPEGTTTDGSSVLPYKKGLFGVAQELGVPIVPAALVLEPRDLAWIGDDTFVPHYLRLAAKRGARAIVKLGEPLPARAYLTPGALADAARARTISLLGEGAADLRRAD